MTGTVASTVSGYSIDEMEDDIRRGIDEVVHIVTPTYNGRVRSYLRTYIELSPRQTEIMMGRAALYFDLFEKELTAQGMPTDLKYLAVVESALLPNATSHVGAGGIWQFMRPTGREFGLRITQYVDERRDPQKSTVAAVNYLKQLYDRFGSWELAMAAYNAGPGRVNYAIRKSGSTDYWTLSKYLPRETRAYVPGFIAVNYLFHHYANHRLTPKMPDEELLNTGLVHIYDGMSFTDINKVTGVSLKTINLLNPSYTRRYIPRSASGYALKLPVHALYPMYEHLGVLDRPDIPHLYLAPLIAGQTLEFEERVTHQPYYVRQGDNLYDIALANDCTVNDIMTWSGIGSSKLRIGQKLTLKVTERIAIIPPLRHVIEIPKLAITNYSMAALSHVRQLDATPAVPVPAIQYDVPDAHVILRRRMSLYDAKGKIANAISVTEENLLPGYVINLDE